MRAFDAGICDQTTVSVLTYFESNKGFVITPYWDTVSIHKMYGPQIIITNGVHGVNMWNENGKKLEDYNQTSSMMRHIVGQRNDQKFEPEWIKTLPRLRTYTFGKEEEDGKIITEFFAK